MISFDHLFIQTQAIDSRSPNIDDLACVRHRHKNMTSKTVTKLEIQATSEAVWSYVTDFSKAAQWMTGVQSLVRLDEGDIGRGSHLHLMSGGRLREVTVSYWQTGKCFALTAELGDVRTTFTYRIENVAEISSLELSIECSFSGLKQFLAPLIRWLIHRRGAKQLPNVKSQLERL